MSTNFQTVELDQLPFPSTMLIDYIRVYQKKGQKNIGCDPTDFPTQDYINRCAFRTSSPGACLLTCASCSHIDAYTNPNFTTWAQAGNSFPKNRLIDDC